VSIMLQNGSVIFQWVSGPIKTELPNSSWEEPGIDTVAEAETRISNEQSTFFDGFRC